VAIFLLPVVILPVTWSSACVPFRRSTAVAFLVVTMKLRHFLLPMLVGVSYTAFTAGIAPADEIARWNFDQEPIGWVPSGDAELSLAEGQLRILSKGDDPYVTAKVDGRGGPHRISISAKFQGEASFQVFWTTEAEPAAAEERSVTNSLRGSKKDARTVNLYFSTESPVTSIRIDPIGGQG
jgi:hypothetical protein